MTEKIYRSFIATAIRIGNPVNWKRALNAIRVGWNRDIGRRQRNCLRTKALRKEGIFVEPASAASIAGLKKLIESNEIDSDETIVCVATGHGLKDPEAAVRACEKVVEIEPSLSALAKVVRE